MTRRRTDGAEAVAGARSALLGPAAVEHRLAPDSPALHLLQFVRDEAHRFGVTYHRNLRGKGAIRSTLDDVDGIGPKRRKALLRQFGSLDGIRAATIEELAAVPGMTRRAAEDLKAQL